MNIKDKREWCKKAYTSSFWKDKVDQMPEKQIEALFIKLRKQGRINI